MNKQQIFELGVKAHYGQLAHQIAVLQEEQRELRAQFPTLFRNGTAAAPAAPQQTKPQAPARTTSADTSSGTKMSPAKRKEVSARMKKYWADRRKAKAAETGGMSLQDLGVQP